MILEHDPQLAKAVYKAAHPEAGEGGYERWLRNVQRLAGELGYKLVRKPQPKRREPMVAVYAKVPPKVKEKLILLSERRGVSLSEVVRQALVRFLEEEGMMK